MRLSARSGLMRWPAGVIGGGKLVRPVKLGALGVVKCRLARRMHACGPHLVARNGTEPWRLTLCS
jgi:hypothetical protein